MTYGTLQSADGGVAAGGGGFGLVMARGARADADAVAIGVVDGSTTTDAAGSTATEVEAAGAVIDGTASAFATTCGAAVRRGVRRATTAAAATITEIATTAE